MGVSPEPESDPQGESFLFRAIESWGGVSIVQSPGGEGAPGAGFMC